MKYLLVYDHENKSSAHIGKHYLLPNETWVEAIQRYYKKMNPLFPKSRLYFMGTEWSE
jgi:hypothetical protein